MIAGIDAAFDKILNKVKELIEEAAQAGKDISDCTNTNLPLLEQLKENAKQKAIACQETAKADAQAAFDKAKADMPDISQQAKDLIDEFMACSGVICKAKVLVKAAGINAQNTVTIGVVITKTTATLTGVAAGAAVCLTKASAENVKEATNILAEIIKCAREK